MLPPLYVVTTVFNPRRFQSRPKLYKNFKKWIGDSGVKLVTVEVTHRDFPFEVTTIDNPYDVQLQTNSNIWHKERALNIGIQHLNRLHPDWQYFAYLDCDVKILRDDWTTQIVKELQHYAVLQPFGEVQTLDPDHHTLYGGRSITRNFAETGDLHSAGLKYNNNLGWPGLGWAYRREEFEKIGGLLDICVTGSGDTHMAGCYMGRPNLGLAETSSAGFKKAVKRYADLSEKYIRRNVGFVPGLLVHYWHGKAKNRGYDVRNKAIREHGFDPYEDLILEPNGLYRWADHKWELEQIIRKTMENRNEDSIDS